MSITFDQEMEVWDQGRNEDRHINLTRGSRGTSHPAQLLHLKGSASNADWAGSWVTKGVLKGQDIVM